MFLLTLAAVAAAQWTGPRTVEYEGPGYYCGGGYAVRLGRGERVLVVCQKPAALEVVRKRLDAEGLMNRFFYLNVMSQRLCDLSGGPETPERCVGAAPCAPAPIL